MTERGYKEIKHPLFEQSERGCFFVANEDDIELTFASFCLNDFIGRLLTMPILARFYGMIIKMFFIQNEHNPPHIHCIYGEYNASIDIQTLKMLEGDLPHKALALVLEWATLHQKELLEIWQTQEFRTIPPLK